MKLTSMTAQVDALTEQRRRSAPCAFVRSRETTRGSRRRGSASWPRPTSTAWTRTVPRRRRKIREAAGLGTHVKADEAPGIHREAIEGSGQLLAAPRDIGQRRFDLDRGLRSRPDPPPFD